MMPKRKKSRPKPKDMVKGVSYKFAVDFNRRDMVEVEKLSEKVYDAISKHEDSVLMVEEDFLNGGVSECYFYNGLKAVKKDGNYHIYHTYTEPYMKVLDRLFLKLLLENINGSSA